MKGIRKIGILIFICLFAAPLYAKLDIFLKPGIEIYGDTVGYHVSSGVRIPVKEFFGLKQFTPNLISGAEVLVLGGAVSTARIFNLGVGLDVGYNFKFNFKSNFYLSATPFLMIGWAYGSLQDTLYGFSQKMGVLLYPKAEFAVPLGGLLQLMNVNFPTGDLFQLGLDFGFPLFIYDLTVFSTSINFNITFLLGR